MARPLTSQSLGVFWSGEEVDGFSIYAYWTDTLHKEPELAVEAWPPGTEKKCAKMSGPGWTVWCWDLRVSKWPAAREWPELVEGLLQQLIDQGATISWGGLEGFFVEPPDLFESSEMSGGVWVAMPKGGGIIGPSGLESSFRVLDDSQLTQLREAIK